MPVNQDLRQKAAKPSFALIRFALRYEPKDAQGCRGTAQGGQAELLFGISFLCCNFSDHHPERRQPAVATNFAHSSFIVKTKCRQPPLEVL